ncbi:PEP-CTERM sorting domain-containing protein [Paludisphaera borealis]|uniref:Ice-binding protein C-terminal domain-containing protein n=1 Tax=Paludisphaera borealis TaxID=1387353 RepID=A0A1U7CW86_9BACT|nr:PEP-CTERM sorting domain-containing protein [Paludisphaera borealis]APW63204.1 hypothetical protein BSF38_04768 [Paludisphaera borealis]
MLTRSMRKTPGISLGRTILLVARQALAIGVCVVAAGRAGASPYIVTDLGRVSDMQQNGQSFDNTKTGVSYAFPNTLRNLTDAEMANLPTYSATMRQPPPPNWDNSPSTKIVTMNAWRINDSGTVIGTLDKVVDRFGNPVNSDVGYTVRSPDGTYSPFVTLSAYPASASAHYYLSQANQILITDPTATRLVDLNTGRSTSIDQLIPQQLLQNYPGIPFVQGIDDRGDIVIYADNQYTGSEAFMLTPPGLDPPPVPEPSTLLIFAAAGALVVRTARRRRLA